MSGGGRVHPEDGHHEQISRPDVTVHWGRGSGYFAVRSLSVTMGSISKKAANADNVCHATPEKWLFWAPPEPRTQAGVESRFIPSFAENNT